MGDCSACEFAQTAHLPLGVRSRAFSLKRLLSLRGRVPRTNFITGIIIDDMIYMEKVLRNLDGNSNMAPEASARIAAMDQQYRTVGLKTHPKKIFPRFY